MGTLLPMHVLKGKKLPGHMGHETVTIQNLEIIAVDLENNVILVKGNVPGPKKSLVIIKSSVKKGNKIKKLEELISYVEIPIQEEALASEVDQEVGKEQPEVEEPNQEKIEEKVTEDNETKSSQDTE